MEEEGCQAKDMASPVLTLPDPVGPPAVSAPIPANTWLCSAPWASHPALRGDHQVFHSLAFGAGSNGRALESSEPFETDSVGFPRLLTPTTGGTLFPMRRREPGRRLLEALLHSARTPRALAREVSRETQRLAVSSPC